MEQTILSFKEAYDAYRSDLVASTGQVHIFQVKSTDELGQQRFGEQLFDFLRENDSEAGFASVSLRGMPDLRTVLPILCMQLEREHGFSFKRARCWFEELNVRLRFHDRELGPVVIREELQDPSHESSLLAEMADLSLQQLQMDMHLAFFAEWAESLRARKRPFVLYVKSVDEMRDLSWLVGAEQSVAERMGEVMWVVCSNRQIATVNGRLELPVRHALIDQQSLNLFDFELRRCLQLLCCLDVWDTELLTELAAGLHIRRLPELLEQLAEQGWFSALEGGLYAVDSGRAAAVLATCKSSWKEDVGERLLACLEVRDQSERTPVSSLAYPLLMFAKARAFLLCKRSPEECFSFFLSELKYNADHFSALHQSRVAVQLIEPFAEASYERSGPTDVALEGFHFLLQEYLKLGHTPKALAFGQLAQQVYGNLQFQLDKPPIELYELLFEAYVRDEQWRRADESARELIMMNREHHGEHAPGTIRAVLRLAYFYEHLERYGEAADMLMELLTDALMHYDLQHELITQILEQQMELFKKIEHHPSIMVSAQLLYDRARMFYGEHHSYTLSRKKELAERLYDGEEFGQALSLYAGLVHDYMNTLGDVHPTTMELMVQLAGCQYALAEYKEARELLEHVLSALTAMFPGYEQEIKKTTYDLGCCLRELGELDAAEGLWTELLQSELDAYGALDERVLYLRRTLIHLQQRMNRYDEAFRMHSELLIEIQEQLGEHHHEAVFTMYEISRMYEEQKNWQEAIRWCEQASVHARSELGEDHPQTWALAREVAELQNRAGDCELAVARMRKVIKGLARLFTETDHELFSARMKLAMLLRDAQKQEEALALFEELYELYNKQLRSGDEDEFADRLLWHIQAIRARDDVELFEDLYDLGATLEDLAKWYGECQSSDEYGEGGRVVRHAGHLHLINSQGKVVGRFFNQASYNILGANPGMTIDQVRRAIGIADAILFQADENLVESEACYAAFSFDRYWIRFHSDHPDGPTHLASILLKEMEES